MKKYFITKAKDVYNFHIFPDVIKKKNFKKQANRTDNTEISFELLLDNYKNRK